MGTTEGPKTADIAATSPAGSRQLSSHAPECFWSTRILGDGTPQVRFVSQGWKQIWGYEPEAILSDPHLWLKAVHPADQPVAPHATVPVRDERREGCGIIDGFARAVDVDVVVARAVHLRKTHIYWSSRALSEFRTWFGQTYIKSVNCIR